MNTGDAMPRPTKLIAWGGTQGLEAHRHVHYGFVRAAQKMGWKSQIVPDLPESRQYLTPGTLVITADLYGNNIGPAVEGVDYVIHNFNGDHILCQSADPKNLLRLQVWTNDAFGTRWADFRSYDAEGRILFQPWGTDLFAEEFMDPVYKPYSKNVTYVGAIWSELYNGTELGNVGMIDSLRLLCADSSLQFQHLTQVSDNQNINAVRDARLAPGFAGNWQVDHNYLPCRVFKNISYGVLGFTNVPALKTFLDLPQLDMNEMFEWALKLKRTQYLDTVRRQQRKISHYSYRESLVAIARALELGKL
jgi:hypothetical protein